MEEPDSEDDMPPLEELGTEPKVEEPEDDEDEPEEEEEEDTDVMKEEDGDISAPQENAPDPNKEPSDDDYETAGASKAGALDAQGEGDWEKAVALWTKAVLATPNAMVYANRGNALLKMKKPVAAIRDADEALKINPDSAKAYKVRGKAEAMLGRWQEAAKDLGCAQRIDYDEDTYEVQKKVTEKLAKQTEALKARKARQEARQQKRQEKLRRQVCCCCCVCERKLLAALYTGGHRLQRSGRIRIRGRTRLLLPHSITRVRRFVGRVVCWLQRQRVCCLLLRNLA